MQIKTQLQSKRWKENGLINILLSRKTFLSEEIYVKSVFTLGKILIWETHFSSAFFIMCAIVAELGGYLGMTLGFSLLDLEMLLKKILHIFDSNK